MKKIQRYAFEGITLDISLYYDERSGIYIEDLPDFAEEPVWTAEGHPVMLTVEDPCEWIQPTKPEHCSSCGECRYYIPVEPGALFGVCRHEERRRKQSGQE